MASDFLERKFGLRHRFGIASTNQDVSFPCGQSELLARKIGVRLVSFAIIFQTKCGYFSVAWDKEWGDRVVEFVIAFDSSGCVLVVPSHTLHTFGCVGSYNAHVLLSSSSLIAILTLFCL